MLMTFADSKPRTIHASRSAHTKMSNSKRSISCADLAVADVVVPVIAVFCVRIWSFFGGFTIKRRYKFCAYFEISKKTVTIKCSRNTQNWDGNKTNLLHFMQKQKLYCYWSILNSTIALEIIALSFSSAINL